MKEPYFSPKTILHKRHEYHLSVLKALYTWMQLNARHFYSLKFKKCSLDSRSHFWNFNFVCLRCKRTGFDIDREHYLRRLLKEGTPEELQKFKENYEWKKNNYICSHCHTYSSTCLFKTPKIEYNHVFKKHSQNDVWLCRKCFNKISKYFKRDVI